MGTSLPGVDVSRIGRALDRAGRRARARSPRRSRRRRRDQGGRLRSGRGHSATAGQMRPCDFQKVSMMFEPVFVEGLDEVQVALRELPDATARNVLKRVAKKVLQPIADRAAMLAPVDKGRLRTSIIVGEKLSRRQRSQFQRTDPNDVVMFVGAGAVPQAHMQEFGTINQEPQPFMRPAWDAGKDKVLDDLKGELWAAIEKADRKSVV